MASKRHSDRQQFLAAITLAAIYGIERFTLPEFAKSGWKLLMAVVPWRGKKDVALGKRRMSHCEQCILFYAPLRTCGSPLADNPELGCWCHLPKVVDDPDAECWADNHTESQIGWKPAGL